MNKADRAARLDNARAIGRTAFRLARSCEISGFIEPRDGGRQRVRTFRREALRVDLYEAASREPSVTDVSALYITYNGRKRFHITWNAAGDFRLHYFDQLRREWLGWLGVEPMQPRRRRSA